MNDDCFKENCIFQFKIIFLFYIKIKLELIHAVCGKHLFCIHTHKKNQILSLASEVYIYFLYIPNFRAVVTLQE